MIGVEPMKTKFAFSRFAVQPHRQVPPAGFESATFGLKDRCSTTELRWHKTTPLDSRDD